MPATPIWVQCKCGWGANIKPGRILSVICPKCGEKVWITPPAQITLEPTVTPAIDEPIGGDGNGN